MTIESKNHPDPEFRFFYSDPQSDTYFFRTAEDRDTAAKDAVDNYLDDTWCDGVDQIFIGEATGHVVARNVEKKPVREDFESDADFEMHCEEMGWSQSCDYDYRLTYEVAPLDDKGEEVP